MQTTGGNRALGKGLASLIPRAGAQAVPAPSEGYFPCPIDDIVPSRGQPRKIFSKEGLEELAASIQEQGIIQPLIVRRMEGGKYELIAGERRLRAAKLAGLASVPVVVSSAAPEQVLELALIENIQREDLNPIEEALAYKELQDRYRFTQEEIARRVGKERSSVTNALRLLALPEEIRGDIIEGRLSMGQARALLAIEDDDLKIKIKKRILEDGLSVREVEKLSQEVKAGVKVERRVQTKLTDPQLTFIEQEMTKILGTKVRIKARGPKGKVVIDYYSSEDLDRVFNAIIG
ncbi:MAG: ParB/RepB/Spo0J family partition protein [Deltaproteobacteria bacterium]|nr:ParB/RepB/Spo0J family partition protein [Deltaproteobacteria bacterium]